MTEIREKERTRMARLYEFLIGRGDVVWRLAKESQRLLLFTQPSGGVVFGAISTSDRVCCLGYLQRCGGSMVLYCDFSLPERLTKRRLEELSVYLCGHALNPEENAVLSDNPTRTVLNFAAAHGYRLLETRS